MQTRKLWAPAFLAGLVLMFLWCLGQTAAQTQVGNAGALQEASGVPWQVGGSWVFTAGSSPTAGFNIRGISFYKVLFVPTGTVSACSVSVDSAAGVDANGILVSPSTGGVLSSGTIGSCALAGGYLTTVAAGISNYAQITPTITGSGSVTVTLFGYTNNPSAAAGGGGSAISSPVDGSGFVEVNCKTGCAGSNPNGQTTMANSAPVTLASNQTPVPVSGTILPGNTPNTTPWLANPANVQSLGSITSTQAVTVNTSGLQTVGVDIAGTWTGTLQPRLSMDGTLYGNLGMIPFAPAGPSVSTITANGHYWAVISNTVNFQILGASVTSGTAIVTINGSPSGFGQLAIQSQAANLNATVVQATGSNLHVSVDAAPTTSIQPAGFAASPLTGQVGVTASAVPLASNATHQACITALVANTIPVYVGAAGITTSTGYPMNAGDFYCWQVSNSNLLYLIASTTGASVAWMAQ